MRKWMFTLTTVLVALACGDQTTPTIPEEDDGDGSIDFDGGVSANPFLPPAPPDPNCTHPYKNREDAAPRRCGTGVELAAVLPLLMGLRARLRRRSWASRRLDSDLREAGRAGEI